MHRNLVVKTILDMEQKEPALFAIEVRLEDGSTATLRFSTAALDDMRRRLDETFTPEKT